MQQQAIMSRGILNEPPNSENIFLNHINSKDKEEANIGKEAIFRTTMGDIHICLITNKTLWTGKNFCVNVK